MECPLTFELHADGEALLEATVLAAVPLSLVDLTALVLDARVPFVVLDRALEEALWRWAMKMSTLMTRAFVIKPCTQRRTRRGQEQARENSHTDGRKGHVQSTHMELNHFYPASFNIKGKCLFANFTG